MSHKARQLDFRTRLVGTPELMDDPSCDPVMLERTYRLFKPINQLVAGWSAICRRDIEPVLRSQKRTTMLDIGSGGGDIPRAIHKWAARKNYSLDITAIDPDPRSMTFATSTPSNVRFRQASSRELVDEGVRFDIVISNHLLHHLDNELLPVLRDSSTLATRLVVHNDIERSALAYYTYRAMTAPLPRGSFVHTDGLLSIRRSYQKPELDKIVGGDWSASTQFPFRLLLTHRPMTSVGE